MDYIPLYPYESDPLRILSPRRIQQELPAAPPEPPPAPIEGPPAAERAPPYDPRRASSDIPDAAYWPARGAPPEVAPDADPPPPEEEPESAEPESAEAESPEAESPEAERIRLVRAWLDRNWDLVEAMARAGETPQRPPPPPPAPAEPAKPLPRPHVARADRWTKHKMAEFLRRLAATHSVSAAAQAVGMGRQSAYKLRARLKGQPFDVAWEAAFLHGYDNLAHAALDRALNGVEVPHYHDGKLIGTSRKYDERLTVAMLAMRNRLGAPLMGRYGALAEYHSERWDALLERVETGSVDWGDEHRALGPAGLAPLELPDERTQVDALIEKHAPEAPRRRGAR